MRAHRGGPRDILNPDSEPGKARWLARGNPEEMPRISDLHYHEGMTLSPPMGVCSHVLFFLLINPWLVSLLLISLLRFISPKQTRQGLVPGHWPSWSGGQDSVLSLLWPDFPLWLWNWDPASSRCRPRPPEIRASNTARAQSFLAPTMVQEQDICLHGG